MSALFEQAAEAESGVFSATEAGHGGSQGDFHDIPFVLDGV